MRYVGRARESELTGGNGARRENWEACTLDAAAVAALDAMDPPPPTGGAPSAAAPSAPSAPAPTARTDGKELARAAPVAAVPRERPRVCIPCARPHITLRRRTIRHVWRVSGVCLACVWRVCGVRPCHPALCAALRCAMQGGGGVTDEHAPGSADATEAMGALLGVVSAVRTLAHTVILSPRAPWRSITKPNQVKPTQINKGHPVGASPSLVGRHSRSACMATVCG